MPSFLVERKAKDLTTSEVCPPVVTDLVTYVNNFSGFFFVNVKTFTEIILTDKKNSKISLTNEFRITVVKLNTEHTTQTHSQRLIIPS